MEVTVKKSEVKGKVRVPPSKSQTIRGLMCAALTRGESEVVDPLVCDDTAAALDVLRKVGIHIQQDEGLWRVTGATFRVPDADLYCGESATTLRFMTAICALIPGKCQLVGGPSLSRRPVRSLVEALRKLGIKCSIAGKTTPPVTVDGGKLRGGKTELPGNISSQFISALLLVAPFAEKEVNIRLTTPMTSRPYVLMTLRCLRKFGIHVDTKFDTFAIRRQRYTPTRFEVEGDWSSASYFLALGAVSEGVEIENLSTSSLQGDRVILDFLRNMGAQVRVSGKSVTVSRGQLKAIQADLSDCIDLLPTMAVLAALADGTSEFTGIERARIKESNRVVAVKEGLEKLGVTVTEGGDRLTIAGLATQKPAADEEEEEEDEEEEEGEEGEEGAPEPVVPEPEVIAIDSQDDHRIAMAFGILGTAIGGITISGAECVAKTFPSFWDTLKSIGGEVETNAE
jgi:3-phosphoshikimate 1-carboxyvinyltransferase